MRISIVKDKVLRSLVKGNLKLHELNLEGFEINAGLFELAEQGYITIVETSITGSGMVRTYSFGSILPKGKMFVENKRSFRRDSIWQWIIDFPKNYWMIAAFITLLISQSALIIKLFSKKESGQQIELQVKRGIKSDTITVYRK